MSSITKQPHYVYRKYLKPWSLNEKIYCLMNNKKIIFTNIMNIGKENYFYEFKQCTDKEIEIGKYFAKNSCDNLMHIYEQINNALKKVCNSSDSTRRDEIIEFAKQSEEKHFNCVVEDRLKPMLYSLYKEDFSFLENTTNSMQFFHAIAEQYCRTKKIKENTQNMYLKLGESDIRGENVWMLIRHSIAFKIGLSLFQEKYQVCLLKSENANFITSDQPIINFHSDFDGIPDEFELYYPISPSLAIIVSKQEKYPNKKVIIIDEDEVIEWNNLIAKLSYSQIYSHKKELLEKYIIKYFCSTK